MNISPTAYNPTVSMQSKSSDVKKRTPRLDVFKSYPPAAVAAVNGACWFGVGFVFDKLCKAVFKTNTSNKASLMINGAIGLVMGAITYAKAKSAQKVAQKV